jgi:hypothetical protein
MSVIATLVEPHGVTRIFFDRRDAPLILRINNASRRRSNSQ